jgi:hypothetical protein
MNFNLFQRIREKKYFSEKNEYTNTQRLLIIRNRDGGRVEKDEKYKKIVGFDKSHQLCQIICE